MNRICIEKSTNKLIEFQSGKAPLGTLAANAIKSGYPPDDIEEKYTEDDFKTALLNHESKEDKKAREAKEKNILALKKTKNGIALKYKGKKKSDITSADAEEWQVLNMALELGL